VAMQRLGAIDATLAGSLGSSGDTIAVTLE